MAKNLVIVESPAKAKTIARYLGKDFKVLSSYGHVRDLPKKDIGVDVKNNFEPTYQVSEDKAKVVAELKSAAKGHTVWLASDEDREGEAIAWHIAHLLDLEPEKVNRIVFHEITESAINNAVKNPRHIDLKLVDAQQARRVLDRLVGYELSPVLWKKVRTGLSAGRVQSVAVRLIVEREKEIKDFKPEVQFRMTAVFEAGKAELPAELNHRFKSADTVEKFLSDLTSSDFKISAIDKKPGTRSPSAPFTTSTLQQAASSRLGYSVRQTMTLAQKLYEHGHITYMRTDSVNLAQVAITAAEKYIKDTYGADYVQTRQFRTKSRGAQEAHEAIRPTHIGTLSAGADSGQKKLYELIWRRTVGSQMTPAKIERTEVVIDISKRDEKFTATGEILLFPGFLKVYGGGKDDVILPNLENGQQLKLKSANSLEGTNRGPARYSEAMLVKKLEELGIGRPSTYAPTIGTVQDRGYVEKKDLDGETKKVIEFSLAGSKVSREDKEITVGADRAKLVPTELADVVNDFLMKYFSSIIDYEFTAKAEEEFDDIEDGKAKWQAVLKRFYEHFHPLVEKSEGASREEAVRARELGKDPKSGEPVIVRFGRFGPVLQMGASPDPKDKEAPKPRFAPLPAEETMDAITLEKALPMFNLPRTVGQTAEGEEIVANVGPYGPYVKVGKSFISLKEDDPLKITEDKARQIIKDHAKAVAKKNIAEFGAIKILNGPYGPYVTDGKKNARIPKEVKAEKMTEAEAKKLLDESPVRKWGRKRR